MNWYSCYWNHKCRFVEASTSFEAQQKSEQLFQKEAGRKKVKRSDIIVLLVEKDGKEVTHNPAILG